MLVVVPQAVGDLIALLSAWLLWHGSSGGVALVLLCVGFAGLAGAITFVATGNILSAVRMILVESAVGWSVQWPELHISPDAYSTYYSQLADVTFRIPEIVAVGAVTVTCFLLVGHFAAQRRDSLARPR